MRLFHGKVRKFEMEKASFFLHRERSIPAVPLRFLYSFFSSANDDCRLGARDSIKRFSGHVEITKCLRISRFMGDVRILWSILACDLLFYSEVNGIMLRTQRAFFLLLFPICAPVFISVGASPLHLESYLMFETLINKNKLVN